MTNELKILKKICETFSLTVNDLPAFPNRDSDLIGQALIIGKTKFKNEILSCLP